MHHGARSSPTRYTTSARRATSESRSTSPCIRPTSWAWAPCGFWRPCGILNRSQAGQVLSGQSSSEMFGSAVPAADPGHAVPSLAAPTPCAKLYGHWQTDELSRGVWPVRLLGHPVQSREPPPRRVVRDPQDHPGRRPASRKGLQSKLVMGNLDSKRDWGFAGDYVRGDVADAPAGEARRLHPGDGRGLLESASSWSWAFEDARPRLPRFRRIRRAQIHAARPRWTILLGDPSKASESPRLGARGEHPGTLSG